MTAGGTVTVILSGDLDAGNAAQFQARLTEILAGQPQRLIFELSQVSFIDCAAARLIARTAARLPAGRKPVLRGAPAIARRVLLITGLDSMCEFSEA